MEILDLITHLDQTLAAASQFLGLWLYLILFLIIFAETGLVIAPFLPGDSLLFAVGAMTSLETGLNFEILCPLLILAAILGNEVNYRIGHWLGPQIFSQKNSRLLNQGHLIKAQNFYAKYGVRAMVIGRFMPIIRTFVPFVAGIGHMPYSSFCKSNVLGGILWILSFLGAGKLFGNLPVVKTNFHIVIFVVILISLLPILIEYVKAKKQA